MTPGIMLVSFLFIGISLIVSMILKGKFSKYGKIPLANGMSGKQVAEKMLRENGIFDVQVTASQGFLSDHYDPAKKNCKSKSGGLRGNEYFVCSRCCT
jgi:Zn-dependent membrane protease YugP